MAYSLWILATRRSHEAEALFKEGVIVDSGSTRRIMVDTESSREHYADSDWVVVVNGSAKICMKVPRSAKRYSWA
jgi:3-dehydroquinate synthase class II